jgi:DNA invertase Pin-like site-specific DNA recombinase
VEAAVAAIRAGLANILVINALDRVSRNTLDGLTLVKDAQDEGWRVLSTDGIDSDKVEKLWLTVRMGFAEEERDKISKRTKQGLIKARQAGKQLGRPRSRKPATGACCRRAGYECRQSV